MINCFRLCGEKIGGKHVSFCKSRIGGVSLEDKTGLDVVGLSGGNGTKVRAGRKGGGSGEEYDDPDVGKARRIEEGDRNGGTGADSVEDARGMEGIAGGRLGGDGTGIAGSEEFMGSRDHTFRVSVCMAQALFLRDAKLCRCSHCHRMVFMDFMT